MYSHYSAFDKTLLFYCLETEINNINMPVNAELIGSSTPSNNIAATSTGSGNTGGAGSGKFNSDNGSECSSVTSESIPAG